MWHTHAKTQCLTFVGLIGGAFSTHCHFGLLAILLLLPPHPFPHMHASKQAGLPSCIFTIINLLSRDAIYHIVCEGIGLTEDDKNLLKCHPLAH